MVVFEGLLLKIVVIENQSLLSTQRTFNNTFIAIVFTLLGSVFGLMQTIGSIMSFVESSNKSLKKKIEKLIRLGKIKRQRTDLDKNFSQNEKPAINRFAVTKVYPELTDNRTIANF
jgi:predicted Ser/Thr protein kinase